MRPVWFILLIFFVGCESSSRTLVNQAEEQALLRKGQVAKQLFSQVVRNHRREDDIRFRALVGLSEVSLFQLQDYREASIAIERLIKEFENSPIYQKPVAEWRVELGRLYRVHFDNPLRSLELILPISKTLQMKDELFLEMGLIYMTNNRFDESEEIFQSLWSRSSACEIIKSVQHHLIHLFEMKKRCDLALEWIDRPLPHNCEGDAYALGVEKSYCYELIGEADRAKEVINDLLSKYPESKKLAFLKQKFVERELRKGSR